MTGRVVVIGSLNIDLVVTVPTHPRPGETVLATSLQRLPGGNGANQAVAAARAGADVRLVGCVGEDADGAGYVDRLAGEGVDASAVRRVPGVPTGTALVVVDQTGENSIVVAPGANAEVTVDDVLAVVLAPGDVVLLQLEVPLDVVAAATRRATTAGPGWCSTSPLSSSSRPRSSPPPTRSWPTRTRRPCSRPPRPLSS